MILDRYTKKIPKIIDPMKSIQSQSHNLSMSHSHNHTTVLQSHNLTVSQSYNLTVSQSHNLTIPHFFKFDHLPTYLPTY